VFGANQFAAETEAGRRLITHELAHVVQQADGSVLPRPTIMRRTPAAPKEEDACNVDGGADGVRENSCDQPKPAPVNAPEPLC
jgi:hypothetical protein